MGVMYTSVYRPCSMIAISRPCISSVWGWPLFMAYGCKVWGDFTLFCNVLMLLVCFVYVVWGFSHGIRLFRLVKA